MAQDGFFFIHAADPQLFWGSVENWERTVAETNRLGPAFLVVAGDMVNRAQERELLDLEEGEEMARVYFEALGELDGEIPVRHMAGNHDICDQPSPDTLAWYEERFGKLWYSFDHDGCFFVVLESNVLKDPGGAPEAAVRQMAWLDETLREADRKDYAQKIVFLHHPLCLERPDEGEDYFTLDPPRRGELLGLFHRRGVRAVFSGHYHRNVHVRDGDLELVTTSSCGAPLGDNPVGFRIVKVFPDRVEHAYYGFDELPEKVEMG